MSFEAMSRKEKREFIRQNKTSVPKKKKNKKRKKPSWIQRKDGGTGDETD